MKRITIILTAFSLLSSAFMFGQNENIIHRAGASAELGFSNLFLGTNLFSGNYAKPLLGGGGGLTAFYELQYKHLLFRSGVGFDYTGNRNRLTVPDFTAHIVESPDMTWYYQLRNALFSRDGGGRVQPLFLSCRH